MHTNGDVRCGDCEHYSDEGCDQAAEALVLEGWPRAAVCPEDSADASSCPEFAPGESYALNLDEEHSGREARLQMAALKNFQAW